MINLYSKLKIIKMANSTEINWLNVVSIREFQSYLNSNLSKEIRMVSKFKRKTKSANF
jgi:hypothetical protein